MCGIIVRQLQRGDELAVVKRRKGRQRAQARVRTAPAKVVSSVEKKRLRSKDALKLGRMGLTGLIASWTRLQTEFRFALARQGGEMGERRGKSRSVSASNEGGLHYGSAFATRDVRALAKKGKEKKMRGTRMEGLRPPRGAETKEGGSRGGGVGGWKGERRESMGREGEGGG